MSKNTISLSIYDGSEGSEYIIHKNGDVNITMISNGTIDSEVDVAVQIFGYKKAEETIADLISQGFSVEWPV